MARRPGDRPAQSHELAQRQQIPAPFMDQILLQLRRGGIVRSVRGPAGGFLLARPAQEIHVGDVLRALRGDIAVFKAAQRQAAPAPTAGAVSEFWSRLQTAVVGVLESSTLADLAQRQDKLDQARQPMLYI